MLTKVTLTGQSSKDKFAYPLQIFKSVKYFFRKIVKYKATLEDVQKKNNHKHASAFDS